MRELPELAEVRAAWLNQPEEEIPVDIERLHRRRTWELFSTTRSEIDRQYRRGPVLRRCRGLAFCAGAGSPGAVWLCRSDRVGRRNRIPVSLLHPAPHAPAGLPLPEPAWSTTARNCCAAATTCEARGYGTAHCCWPASSPPRPWLKGSFPAAFGMRCPSFSCSPDGRQSGSGAASGRRLNYSRRSRNSAGVSPGSELTMQKGRIRDEIVD